MSRARSAAAADARGRCHPPGPRVLPFPRCLPRSGTGLSGLLIPREVVPEGLSRPERRVPARGCPSVMSGAERGNGAIAPGDATCVTCPLVSPPCPSPLRCHRRAPPGSGQDGAHRSPVLAAAAPAQSLEAAAPAQNSLPG